MQRWITPGSNKDPHGPTRADMSAARVNRRREGENFLGETEYRREQRGAVRKRVGEVRKKGQGVRRVGTGGRAGGRRKSMEAELLSLREAEKASQVSKANAVVRNKYSKANKSNKGSIAKQSGLLRQQATRGEVVRVSEAWVSGSLTNNEGLSEFYLRKKAMAERGGQKAGKSQTYPGQGTRGREAWLVRKDKTRPGVMVLRNPEEHSLARREAVMCGIPTVGRVTKNRSKESAGRRTYGRKNMKGDEGRVRRGMRMKKALRSV